MILGQKQTTIAYRCPECGCIVRSVVGIFSLSADMIKLKCPCGGSSLDISYTRDHKVRLNVPCLVCPSSHSYLISPNVLFGRELFTTTCTYSGLDICFIGNEDKIDEAIAASEAELIELGGEEALELLVGAKKSPETLSDPQILDIIYYVIKDLEEEGSIHCNCPDGGEYELQLGDEHIYVVCKKCGAEYAVRANSVSAAHDFLNVDEITLE